MAPDYPETRRTREQRLTYLREHRVKEQAFYVNTIGRSTRQIRQEAELRDRLEAFLDSADDLRQQEPPEIRRAVQDHVAADTSLGWTRRPPARPVTFSGSGTPPTLEQVAALAGVSRATVSRVVNGSPTVTSLFRATFTKVSVFAASLNALASRSTTGRGIPWGPKVITAVVLSTS